MTDLVSFMIMICWLGSSQKANFPDKGFVLPLPHRINCTLCLANDISKDAKGDAKKERIRGIERGGMLTIHENNLVVYPLGFYEDKPLCRMEQSKILGRKVIILNELHDIPDM